MATYRYTALDDRGEEVAGVVDAANLDDALWKLVDRKLRNVQVTELREQAAELPVAPVSLSAREAGEFAQQLAHLSSAEVPLSAGLRAAADESDNRRVAAALRWVAEQVDQGRSLEDTLAHSGSLLPTYLAGLILAAARTGTLGEALFEIVEYQQTSRALRQNIADGYLYPLLVLLLAVPILVFITLYVTGPVGEMLKEFGVVLPLVTRLLFWWRDVGIWVIGNALLLVALLAALYRLVGGRARWRRLLATIPLFGSLWHWTGVAEWLGLMSVLLKHQVPLPDALRLAARGIRDANVGRLSLRLADGVARGRSLSHLMFVHRELPSTLIPLFQWGEKTGALSESCNVGREMFIKRVRLRAQLLQSVIPPVLFVAIGSFVLFVVFAQFAPMIHLISALS